MEIGSVILLGGIFLVVIYRSGLSKEFKENNLEFYDLKKWSSLKTASWLIFLDWKYLSLRISMIEEISKEKMPIILDEAFAYFDDERLENILKYLTQKYKQHQLIIFTCTNREKNILDKLNCIYNSVEL